MQKSNSELALVVMAAGMGSRYGGLKQLEGVGPHGETLLEYSIFDALRAGFTKVVFIIRKDIEAVFEDVVLSRFRHRVPCQIVYQEIDALPDGFTAPPDRTKPWGTGHAVLSARSAVECPFAVINADDFYGAQAYQRLVQFFEQSLEPNRYALAAYALENTLSPHGTVARGICEVNQHQLLGITETKDIGVQQGVLRAGSQVFTGQEFVSMNLWGFKPSLFQLLERNFRTFLSHSCDKGGAEFYLPSCVSDAIASAEVEVSILPVTEKWYGVTYREDRPQVEQAIQDAITSGHYPQSLWSQA